MPYRFKRAESVPEGVKRIASEELQEGARQLREQLKGATKASAAARDTAIHEARKSVTKVRAVVRLMRPELDGHYASTIRQLRETGHQLSDLRDSGAIIETFDDLRKKYLGDLGKNNPGAVRRTLLARKREKEQAADVSEVLRSSAASLENLGRTVKKWPLRTDGFPAIQPGLKESFRRGRKALADVRKDPRPEKFHEWRKRVKDNWYHVRLLEDVWTDVMKAHEKSLKNLETWLGDDHNLVVLEEQVAQEPAAFGKDKDVDLLLGVTGKYRKELRENALSLGERIYEEKPRDYVQRLEALWESWQNEPDSLEKELAHGQAS